MWISYMSHWPAGSIFVGSSIKWKINALFTTPVPVIIWCFPHGFGKNNKMLFCKLFLAMILLLHWWLAGIIICYFLLQRQCAPPRHVLRLPVQSLMPWMTLLIRVKTSTSLPVEVGLKLIQFHLESHVGMPLGLWGRKIK